MAIERTGTAVTIGSYNNSDSQSITVPADCTLAVISVADANAAGTVSINSVNATFDVSASDNWLRVYHLPSPSTGSQTFAWSGFPLMSGLAVIIAFYKGVDTASPVRDSDSAVGSSSPGTATTPSMTSQSGDMAVAGCAAYNGALTLTNNGQSSVATQTKDTTYSGMAELLASGATITMTVDGPCPCIAAIVLKPAAGGASSTWVPFRRMNILLRLCLSVSTLFGRLFR